MNFRFAFVPIALALEACSAALYQSTDPVPASAAQRSEAARAIVRDTRGHPPLFAPIRLPMRDSGMLRALQREKLVAVAGARQRYVGPPPPFECDDEASVCYMVPIAKASVANDPIIEAQDDPQTPSDGEHVMAYFRFTAIDLGPLGTAGIAAHYWVTFNALAKACPAPFTSETTFIGRFSHHVTAPDLGPETRIEPALEVAAIAATPKPNDIVCAEQYLE